MRTAVASQALLAVLTEEKPASGRLETNRIETLLVESIIANPRAASGAHVSYIERTLGRSVSPREYRVKDAMRKYRMWFAEIRESGVNTARVTAATMAAALTGEALHTRGTLYDETQEFLPWSGKATLLLLSRECAGAAARVRGHSHSQVSKELGKRLPQLDLSKCNTLLRTIMNLVAPAKSVTQTDAHWLEMQFRVAQAQADAYRREAEETEQSAFDRAVADLARDLNSEDSRYLLDQVYLLGDVRSTYEQQGRKMPPGFAVIFTTGKAILRYLDREGVQPFEEIGRIFTLTDVEINEEAYELRGEEFAPGETPCVRITAPGWRHRGEVIMPPKVEKVTRDAVEEGGSDQTGSSPLVPPVDSGT